MIKQQQLQEQGFHLNDKFFSEHGDANVDHLYEIALNSDLRHIGAPSLPDNVSSTATHSVPGVHVLQLLSVHNIAQPSARQNTPGLYPQVLQLRLTDGIQRVTAIEVATVPQLSVVLAPGTKLCVRDCRVRNGKLLLSDVNCNVLGGRVHELFTSWKANKDLKEKKRVAGADKADPPPPFTDFVAPASRQKLTKKQFKDDKAAKSTQASVTVPPSSEKNQKATAKKSKLSEKKEKPAKSRKEKEQKEQKEQKKQPVASQQKRKEKHAEDGKSKSNKASITSLPLNIDSKEFVPALLRSPPLPPPPPATVAGVTQRALIDEKQQKKKQRDNSKPTPSKREKQEPHSDERKAVKKESFSGQRKFKNDLQPANQRSTMNDGKSAGKRDTTAGEIAANKLDRNLKNGGKIAGTVGQKMYAKKQQSVTDISNTNTGEHNPEDRAVAAAQSMVSKSANKEGKRGTRGSRNDGNKKEGPSTTKHNVKLQG